MPNGIRIDTGLPYPLGASWDGVGTNFALFSSSAEKVELCLFDRNGGREQRVELPGYTDEVWHGYLPNIRPGQLYGYRVYGPYDPANGHRFNANKLLIDPYAKALFGQIHWTDAHFAYRVGSSRQDLSFDRRDNARGMPKSVVIDPAYTWGKDRRPRRPWQDTIVYEAHVAGLTQLNENVPQGLRGSFAGLASHAIVDHLVSLGVTALELLPVQAAVNDRYLVQKGLSNYWGYNTIGFFAPDPRFLGSGAIDEFKSTVNVMHQAGIEVILDVVYNHTGEGNHMGPTLCFKGIDNRAYYHLKPDDARYYDDFTGTGNSLNLEHPRVVQMVMDSLRYWTSEMHVDGFRFDLATELGRRRDGFSQESKFLNAVMQDPVLSSTKLIAEPWDVGMGGYQVGGFPPGWSEWNDKYRDCVRKFWRADPGLIGEMASRLTGSADVFDHRGRKPWTSVNFLTAHDGFCLADLVSYNEKHNEANGEENRDGISANWSWNCGVEGVTDDPEILALRARQQRNFIATLFLSIGVPMLLAGDEFGNTQDGNNNTYCHDDPLGWVQWPGDNREKNALLDFTKRMTAVRNRFPQLRRSKFLTGAAPEEGKPKDITWITPSGTEVTEEDWSFPEARCLAFVLAAEGKAPALFAILNAHFEPVEFTAPEGAIGKKWRILVATSPDGREAGQEIAANGKFEVEARSTIVLECAEP